MSNVKQLRSKKIDGNFIEINCSSLYFLMINKHFTLSWLQ